MGQTLGPYYLKQALGTWIFYIHVLYFYFLFFTVSLCPIEHKFQECKGLAMIIAICQPLVPGTGYVS
jgi:hypothetical protein